MKKTVILALAAVLLITLAACSGGTARNDGNPPGKTNMMPHGVYTGSAGTLTFNADDPVAPGADGGTVLISLSPDYLRLPDGQQNDTLYEFRIDRSNNLSDRQHWYVFSYAEAENGGDMTEIFLFEFIWNREGWDTGEDEVIIQSADENFVFEFTS